MSAKTATLTAALVLTLASGLAACSSDATGASPTPAAATPTTETAAPVETPAPQAPAAPTVELPDVYFPGADIRLPIDPALPIQEDVIEAVRAETTANAEAIIATNPASTGVPTDEQLVAINSAKAGAGNLVAGLSEATGRTVFLVYQAWGGDDAGHYEMKWVVTNSENIITGVRSSTTKDAVVDGITAWVAAQSDPAAYEIVVS